MTIKDNILSYLKKNSIKICDDCLTKELDFNQRQTAFSNCRDLHNKGLINRDKAICNLCGKDKNCSWNNDKSFIEKENILKSSAIVQSANRKELINTKYSNIDDNIYQSINAFMKNLLDNLIDVYNEFSLQHELGIYLRVALGRKYKIEFERNVSFFNIDKSTLKREMDIVIYTPDFKEKYCIELKYPTNGQYPEQMYSMCKDIKFLEQLKDNGFTRCYSVNLVENATYYSGNKSEGIYIKFRNEKRLYGKIEKPTGSNYECINLNGEYNINWITNNKVKSYFIVKI